MEKGRGVKPEEDVCMLVIDMKKAHLCAPAAREVFIELPSQDRQEGEEDSGDHYRDSAGPIRGYPGARSDAFVWRPY